MQDLFKKGVDSAQDADQARTAFDAAKARVDSLRKQVEAAQAGVALAKSGAEQTAARKAALEASTHQLAAMGAQKDKAKTRLGYTKSARPSTASWTCAPRSKAKSSIPARASSR